MHMTQDKNYAQFDHDKWNILVISQNDATSDDPPVYVFWNGVHKQTAFRMTGQASKNTRTWYTVALVQPGISAERALAHLTRVFNGEAHS